MNSIVLFSLLTFFCGNINTLINAQIDTTNSEIIILNNESDDTKDKETTTTTTPTSEEKSCFYSIKYEGMWPNCDWSNNVFMSATLAEFQGACDKHSNCVGFTYPKGTPPETYRNAGGNLKLCGGANEGENGYDYGSFDFFAKGKCGGCPNTIAGLYNNDTITITVDDQNQITVNMSYYNRSTATGEVTHSDATYFVGHITFKDERRYRIYYHKNEGKIYWDSPNKEYISRIWKKDSCLDGSAFIPNDEIPSIANISTATTWSKNKNGVAILTLIVFFATVIILLLFALLYSKKRRQNLGQSENQNNNSKQLDNQGHDTTKTGRSKSVTFKMDHQGYGTEKRCSKSVTFRMDTL